ncbi:hypothetical protein N9231_02415 [Saprospiraceae bacterium]|nr:hypothetical protein [Saprospiraceae bacterium]
MDKFFNSTFDALTNVVPGSIILVYLLIFDTSINSLDLLILKLNNIEIGSAAVVIFVSYVIGFAISPIGKYVYQKIGYKIWPANTSSLDEFTISEKFILIRQYSPSNFKYVESWNMFCTLAHNLAITSLILILNCIIRIILFGFTDNFLFVFVAVFAVLSFFIFINRAVSFRNWALNDLNTAVKTLDLINEMKSGPKRFEINLKRE